MHLTLSYNIYVNITLSSDFDESVMIVSFNSGFTFSSVSEDKVVVGDDKRVSDIVDNVEVMSNRLDDGLST